MESDDRIISAINRVFETENGISYGRDDPQAMHTKEASVYRVTGMNQIKDILACGYVRPRKGRLKGGHYNEIFWSKGSNRLYYKPGSIILEAPSDKVKNHQIGAIPFDDLIGIWQFNNETAQYENKIDSYKKIYNEINEFESSKKR